MLGRRRGNIKLELTGPWKMVPRVWLEGSRPYWMEHTTSPIGKEQRTVVRHLSEVTEWLSPVNPSDGGRTKYIRKHRDKEKVRRQ